MDFVLDVDNGVNVVDDSDRVGLFNIDDAEDSELITLSLEYASVSKESFDKIDQMLELNDIVVGSNVVIAKETAKIIYNTLKNIAPNNRMPNPNCFSKHNAMVFTSLAQESIIDSVIDGIMRFIEWLKGLIERAKNYVAGLFGKVKITYNIKQTNIISEKLKEAVKDNKEYDNAEDEEDTVASVSTPESAPVSISAKITKNKQNNKEDATANKPTKNKSGTRMYKYVRNKSQIVKLFTYLDPVELLNNPTKDSYPADIDPSHIYDNILHVKNAIIFAIKYLELCEKYTEVINKQDIIIRGLIDKVNTNIDAYRTGVTNDVGKALQDEYIDEMDNLTKFYEQLVMDIDDGLSKTLKEKYYSVNSNISLNANIDDLISNKEVSTIQGGGKYIVSSITSKFAATAIAPIPTRFLFMNNVSTVPSRQKGGAPTFKSYIGLSVALISHDDIKNGTYIPMPSIETLTLVQMEVLNCLEELKKLEEISKKSTDTATNVLNKSKALLEDIGNNNVYTNLIDADSSVRTVITDAINNHQQNISGLLFGPHNSVTSQILPVISNLLDPNKPVSYQKIAELASMVHK